MFNASLTHFTPFTLLFLMLRLCGSPRSEGSGTVYRCTNKQLVMLKLCHSIQNRRLLPSLTGLSGVHYVVMILGATGPPTALYIPPVGDTLCRQRDAASTSIWNWCALSICLHLFKWTKWSQWCSRLTPAVLCREGHGILSSILNWCVLSIWSVLPLENTKIAPL